MLKQPLLSRLFKFREANEVPAEKERLDGSTEGDLIESSSTESVLTAGKIALPTEEPVGEKSGESDSNAQEPLTPKNSAANTAVLEKSLAATAVEPAVQVVSADIEKSDEGTDENSSADKKPSDGVGDAAAPQSGRKRRKLKLPKVTTARAAISLGVLAAVAGAVVPRVVSPTLRASIAAKLSGPAAPVSSPDDPVAESLVTTGNLFVTNQILYRKLEAIAGVTLISPEDRVAPTLPVPSATTTANADSKPTSDNKSTESKSSADTSTAAAAGDAPKNVTDAANSEDATQPDPDVNVTAAAPPAPLATPVDFTGTTIDSVLEMRVAVAKDVSGIGFATSGSGVITDLDGNELKALSPETGVMAEDAGGLMVDGELMPSAFWVYPDDGGYVAIGDSWFRGRMLIAQRERGLIAVNYVLLGDYLYSVVGTEMSPDWAIESLKAQAVAARSYALTHNIHPASEAYFDLDNTQRFQAYKGLNREANTTQAAVQATAGEFISHEGGIVESLYAASQAIVDDAHRGAWMIQLEAKALADQGYSYHEILAHYYPGSALGRLETD